MYIQQHLYLTDKNVEKVIPYISCIILWICVVQLTLDIRGHSVMNVSKLFPLRQFFKSTTLQSYADGKNVEVIGAGIHLSYGQDFYIWVEFTT